MIETWKFAMEAKSVVTEDGIELSYCELGEENEEIIITGAFYFHTWLPVVTELAKKYHIYGYVMRFGDGGGTQFNEDGTIHWSKQWGDDLYKFAKALGIEKFNYLGKCHGTVPGWYMIKEHPEMINSFCSFYLAPRIMEPNSDQWGDTLKMSLEDNCMRTQRGGKAGVAKKVAEIKALSAGPAEYGKNPPDAIYHTGSALFWDTPEECLEFAKNVDIPICYMFGTDDILFQDWKDNDIEMILNTKRARTVIIQGERHLMCMDAADRIASEADFFIQECKKNYQ